MFGEMRYDLLGKIKQLRLENDDLKERLHYLDGVLKLSVKRCSEAEDVLRTIAAYDDKWANEKLAATGSWGSFDEPGSVQLARKYLEMKP